MIEIFEIEVDGSTYAIDAIKAQLPHPECDRDVPVLTGNLPGLLPKGLYRVKSFYAAYGHRYENCFVIVVAGDE